ncbi:sulfurase [Actinocatenispora thailandica]|uniref:Sulfurase n=1 Tax=Actinocatenispora thailandica TaxID=227318 RepID=A0A7R7DUU6_9ACTN|nr:MOSC domain-containing protein [Actinocatenispora thailandica]BCJ38248.1 sulfurase [Actinocatenispora thailandica]
MGVLVSVNVGRARETAHSDVGVTGIDKRPVTGPVPVRAPGPRGAGGSGLAGDTVCDLRFHGGDEQAVYAYAREDLDWWSRRLGRPLANGTFGDNLTTSGVPVTDAVIGERWRIGTAVLQVCSMRIPCRTFAGWLDEHGWMKTFTEQARPGAYLRVLVPGEIRAGDEVAVTDRPAHGVTAGVVFRALTREPALLPELLRADELDERHRGSARNRLGRVAST